MYKRGTGVHSINPVCMIEFIFYYTHISIILRTMHPLSVDHPLPPLPLAFNYATCTTAWVVIGRADVVSSHGIFPAVLSSMPGELFSCDRICIAVSCAAVHPHPPCGRADIWTALGHRR